MPKPSLQMKKTMVYLGCSTEDIINNTKKYCQHIGIIYDKNTTKHPTYIKKKDSINIYNNAQAHITPVRI